MVLKIKSRLGSSFLFSTMFFFFFIFSFSFVSSVSLLTGAIDDVCLPFNYQYYDINLTQYYDFDLTEEVQIYYHDPINGRLLGLAAGYSSLNLECFEIGYYFNDGDDWIRIESLDEGCTDSILVKLLDTSGINQNFDLTVSDTCPSNPQDQTGDTDPEPSQNASFNLVSGLVTFYNFDDSLEDSKNTNDAVLYGFSNGTESYSSSAVQGKSFSFTGSTALNSSLPNQVSNSWAYSFWFDIDDSWDNQGDMRLFDNSSTDVRIQNLTHLYSKSSPTVVQNVTLDLTSTGFHHVVFTYNNSDLSLYFDNSLVGSVSGAATDLRESITIGTHEVGVNQFHGEMDLFSVYNISLNSSDVSFLYNSGSGLSFNGTDYLSSSVSGYIDDLLRVRFSLDRGSRTEFVNVNKMDHFNENFEKMGTLKTLTEVRN